MQRETKTVVYDYEFLNNISNLFIFIHKFIGEQQICFSSSSFFVCYKPFSAERAGILVSIRRIVYQKPRDFCWLAN